MRIDSNFRIDRIAADARREILRHVVVTTWHDQPVAVAADGFCLAVVPVEMDVADRPGLIHVSAFERARELAKLPDEDQPWIDVDLWIALGDRQLQLSDGTMMPRQIGPTEWPFPDWTNAVPETIVDATLEPVFVVQPALMNKLAGALGLRFVAVHRADENRIILAPYVVDDILKPPFGVLMLAHAQGRVRSAHAASRAAEITA